MQADITSLIIIDKDHFPTRLMRKAGSAPELRNVDSGDIKTSKSFPTMSDVNIVVRQRESLLFLLEILLSRENVAVHVESETGWDLLVGEFNKLNPAQVRHAHPEEVDVRRHIRLHPDNHYECFAGLYAGEKETLKSLQKHMLTKLINRALLGRDECKDYWNDQPESGEHSFLGWYYETTSVISFWYYNNYWPEARLARGLLKVANAEESTVDMICEHTLTVFKKSGWYECSLSRYLLAAFYGNDFYLKVDDGCAIYVMSHNFTFSQAFTWDDEETTPHAVCSS